MSDGYCDESSEYGAADGRGLFPAAGTSPMWTEDESIPRTYLAFAQICVSATANS